MSRNPFARTGIVLLLAALVGGYLWFVERKKPETPAADAAKPAEKVFAGFDKSKVKAITLSQQGGEEVALVKEKGAWRLTRPLVAAADDNEVQSLLMSVESLELGAVANADAPSAAAYGLEPPRGTAVFEQESAATLALELGDKAPADAGTYARIAGTRRVFTLPSTYDATFAKTAFDLRDRNVLHVARDDVKSIAFRGPEGTYEVARAGQGDGEGGGDWVFTSPFRAAAARWSVDSLLGTLESLRMDKVAAENVSNLAAYGLAKPERTLTLQLKDGAKRTLDIGKASDDGKHFARNTDTRIVAVIPKVVAEDLGKGLTELRAKRLLDVAAYEVESVDIAMGATTSHHVKPADGAAGAAADSWKRVQDGLFAMGGVEATGFIDQPGKDAAYGLDQPALRVTVHRTEGKGATWFEIGKAGGKAYARRPGDQSILELDPAKVETLLKDVAAF